jgi:hypothetical protein
MRVMPAIYIALKVSVSQFYSMGPKVLLHKIFTNKNVQRCDLFVPHATLDSAFFVLIAAIQKKQKRSALSEQVHLSTFSDLIFLFFTHFFKNLTLLCWQGTH